MKKLIVLFDESTSRSDVERTLTEIEEQVDIMCVGVTGVRQILVVDDEWNETGEP